VKRFKSSLVSKPTKAEEYIFNIYLHMGEVAIVRFNEMFNEPEILKKGFLRYKFAKKQGRLREIPENNLAFFTHEYDLGMRAAEFQKMLDIEMIYEKDGQVSANNSAVETAKNFENFLLGIIPSKIIRARSQKHSEPYGTESSSVVAAGSVKAVNAPEGHE
jgi:hypothetical protein